MIAPRNFEAAFFAGEISPVAECGKMATMATFHVFIEGADDRSPDGIQKLAQAISQRYGLSVADLQARLNAGRFRVKANIDQKTADAYARSLREIGARVTLQEVSDTASDTSRPTPMPAMNLRGSTPLPTRADTPPLGARTTTSSLGTPPLGARTTTSSKTATPAQGVVPTRASSPLQSGLSAAFTPPPDDASARAGAFDALGGDALSLSSLDGKADTSPAAGSFAPSQPPDDAPVIRIATGKSAPVAQTPIIPSGPPMDLFAPPDAEENEARVELATEDDKPRAKPLPVHGDASSSSTPAMRRSNPSPTQLAIPAVPRGRYAVGVLVSILLGFVPAHVVASTREHSAFVAIDAKVRQAQNAVEDTDAYNALDGFRQVQLAAKKSAQRSIAWQSMLIWIIVGAGIAYVFFRRIPWGRVEAERVG